MHRPSPSLVCFLALLLLFSAAVAVSSCRSNDPRRDPDTGASYHQVEIVRPPEPPTPGAPPPRYVESLRVVGVGTKPDVPEGRVLVRITLDGPAGRTVLYAEPLP